MELTDQTYLLGRLVEGRPRLESQLVAMKRLCLGDEPLYFVAFRPDLGVLGLSLVKPEREASVYEQSVGLASARQVFLFHQEGAPEPLEVEDDRRFMTVTFRHAQKAAAA